MQVLQALLFSNVAVFTLAQLGPLSNSPGGTSIPGSNLADSSTGSNSDSSTGSNSDSSIDPFPGSEGYKGANPYVLLSRLYSSDDNSPNVKSNSPLSYDVYLWFGGDGGRINETSKNRVSDSNSSSIISGTSKSSRKSSKGSSSDKASYPLIYKWRKSSGSDLKPSSSSKHSSKRQRRNTGSSYYSNSRPRCPCSGRPRGGPSPQFSNWQATNQPRTPTVDFRMFRTRNRRLFGSDSKGGYPFPHSERKRRESDRGGPSPQRNNSWQFRGGSVSGPVDFRNVRTENRRLPSSDSRGGYPFPHSERRRKRSCCTGFRTSSINSGASFRTSSINSGASFRTSSFKAGDLDDAKGGFPFPHSCKKR